MNYYEKMKTVAFSKGAEAFSLTKQLILEKSKDSSQISQALQYFVNVNLNSALPIFPALTALSCEAAGGKAKAVVGVASAIMMISAAADIHDDVIDHSKSKGSILTVYGKFGKETAILAGDSLLVYGFRQLEKECKSLEENEKGAIYSSLISAYSEISKAVSLEASFKGDIDLISTEKLYSIIKLKAAITEMNMSIGAILAHADEATIMRLRCFGRNLGLLSTIAEEYIDLVTYKELKNRLKRECPPLPLLYALTDLNLKEKLLPLINKSAFKHVDFEQVTELVLHASTLQKLTYDMTILVQNEKESLRFIKNETVRESILVFPLAALSCIQEITS
ncbi:MAG: polyprenyl synthetase family protein [Candidatus Bathyarchaeota archaeon]|nr:polyprenyl synthetase family protein [Candidatus Bathyarchaeota archaeon]